MDDQREHNAGKLASGSGELSRRHLLAMLGMAGALSMVGGCSAKGRPRGRDDVRVRAPFRLALMQRSLSRTVGKELARFANIARNEQQFRAIGYNSVMWAEQARDATLLKQLATAASDAGVKPLLLQVDDEGLLGESDRAAQARAVVAHHKWADAAKKLGCEALVVRAGAIGAPAAQADQLAEGLASLSNYTQQLGLRLLVRNGGTGGGMSTNPAWMAGVLRRFDTKVVAGMADFDAITTDAKLRIRKDEGMQTIMPFAASMVLEGIRSAAPLADMPPRSGAASMESLIRKTLDDAIKGRSATAYGGFRGYVFVDVEEASSRAEDQSIRATREYLEAVARGYMDVG